MPSILAFTWLILVQLNPAIGQPPPAKPPDRPGVFAVTDRGVIELTAFGERRPLDFAASVDRFSFRRDAFDRIPLVSSVRSFRVNMMGWTPKDLYLIVGRKRLSTPRDEFWRLNGRAYSLGPVAFEVVTEDLEPPALEQAYRKTAGNRREGEDAHAYVVLELKSASGLSPRSYPVRIAIEPAGK